MIVAEPVGRFEPGLGLLFAGGEVQRMRDVVNSPEFEKVWKVDRRYAER